MNRREFLALCGTGVSGLAGCQTTADDGTPQPSEDSPAGDGTPTETDTGASTDTTTPPSAVAVTYDVEAGDVPDALQSLEVTLQMVLVADTDEMTACLRDTYTGPYKPTVTPIPTPTQDACRRSDPVTVDLTALGDAVSIGPVTAPGSYVAGHALVITDVAATDRDGDPVPIKGAGGHRVAVLEDRADGPSRVQIGLETGPAEAEYDYELISTSIAPTE